MKLLLTGANGILGQKLLQTLTGDLHLIFTLDLQPESFLPDVRQTYTQQDLTARRPTVELISRIEPQVILHAAAMTAVDACETEREQCWRSNVGATENVCAAAAKVGARVIYISTDYVFDGERGPYREEDPPNPVSYYGKSKLAGENVVRGAADNWTVVRTIVLYGFGRNIKSSFVTWLLGELRAGRPVKIVDDQWGNATLADDLAQGIDRLLLLEKQGLYHMGGRGFMTRYEFAGRTARFFGLDERLISAITTTELRQPARRPLRSGLVTEKAERELYFSFRDVEQSLRLYMNCEQEQTKA